MKAIHFLTEGTPLLGLGVQNGQRTSGVSLGKGSITGSGYYCAGPIFCMEGGEVSEGELRVRYYNVHPDFSPPSNGIEGSVSLSFTNSLRNTFTEPVDSKLYITFGNYL